MTTLRRTLLGVRVLRRRGTRVAILRCMDDTMRRLVGNGWSKLTTTVWERDGYTLLLKGNGSAVAINPLGKRRVVNLGGF